MNHRTESRFAVAFSTLVALAAFACSSAPESSIPSSSKDSSPPSSAKKNDDTKSDTSKTTPEPETPLSDTSECGKKTTAQACGDCCIAKNPAAWDAADEVAYTCICAATACQTACAASICATADNQNEPTAECKTCLDTNGQSCDDKATASCDANADCKAIEACLTTSCDPIADKEDQSGGGQMRAMQRTLKARAATRAIRQR